MSHVALVESVDRNSLMEDVQEFSKRQKLSGTPAELESFRYLHGRMNGFGYQTDLISHDAYISLPGAARVVADNQALVAITHSFSRSTPPDGLAGELVDVGDGTAADFAKVDVRGKIVLAQGIASPGVASLALKNGAIGQLHVSPHEHLHEMCISPVWGSPSPETVGLLPATVTCTISHDDGTALRERLARGDSPRIVLHAEVDTGWRKTPVLVCDLAAPNAPPDAPFVMFSGHHDTWYYGVMDNGSANATMIEVARVCAKERASWKRGLRLCFWSGHSHGRYSSSAWYADENFAELAQRCVAHVNVDSTGGIGATVLSETASGAELRTLAAESIAAVTGETLGGKRMSRSSDMSFWGVGIPAMFGALSMQPPSPVKMRNALGWWWHTPHDTIDKIDPEFLVRDTKVFVHALTRLLTSPVVPLDYTVNASELLGEIEAVAGKLGDRLNVAALHDAAVAFKANAERVASSKADPAKIDAALMRVSRALVPMEYTDGDRFRHDPALPQPAWPTLQPLRDLAATAPGTDQASFLTVAARRARNRVQDALRAANEALCEVVSQ